MHKKRQNMKNINLADWGLHMALRLQAKVHECGPGQPRTNASRLAVQNIYAFLLSN